MDAKLLAVEKMAEDEWGTVPETLGGYLQAAYTLGAIREKDIDEVVEVYRLDLIALLVEVLDGNGDADSLARSHRLLLRRVDTEAYLEGLRSGGVDRPELTADDERNINEWLVGQLSFVRGFALSAEQAGTDEALQQGLLSRAGLWADNVRSLALLGLASAQRSRMVTFHLGGTLEHCRVCSRLDGQRHRLSWFGSRGLIPRQRGNRHFDCGGWNCECSLLDDNGLDLAFNA